MGKILQLKTTRHRLINTKQNLQFKKKENFGPYPNLHLKIYDNIYIETIIQYKVYGNNKNIIPLYIILEEIPTKSLKTILIYFASEHSESVFHF